MKQTKGYSEYEALLNAFVNLVEQRFGNRLFPLSRMARFFVLAEMIKNDIHKLKDLKGGRKNA